MPPNKESVVKAHFVLSLVVLSAASLTVRSQCNPSMILSSAAPSTGQLGVMFDMEPTGGIPLRIESFDIYVTGTSLTYEVWARQPLESFVGFQSTMTGWNLLGTATGINGNGTTASVPLNLCLGYLLQAGGRTGFYVTISGTGTHWYFSGTTVGQPWLSDNLLTVYQGHSGGYFSNTISTRNFGGSVRYDLGQNILDMSQSGPGVGNLSLSLSNLSPSGQEGYTFASANVSMAAGMGPAFGIMPDAVTWSIFGYPYLPGSPFHWNALDVGLFPNTPFNAPPGSVLNLTGQTLDFVCVFLNALGSYDSHSNVVRYTFQ
jgi:hypothetical protein